MKVLVVYYSLEGNCKLMAEKMAESVEATVLALSPEKDISPKGFGKYLWGGRQVVMKEKPQLKPYEQDFKKYDLIILGTPVWAGSFAPAFSTFLDENQFIKKKVALFCCHAGGKGKVFSNFKKALDGAEIIDEIDFIDPKAKNTDENIEKAISWIKNVVKQSRRIA